MPQLSSPLVPGMLTRGRGMTRGGWHAGEMFFIGYRLGSGPPSLNYAGLDAQGDLMFDQSIALPHAVMHHDFAITQHHALLIDHCLEFDGKARLKSLPLLPFSSRPCVSPFAPME